MSDEIDLRTAADRLVDFAEFFLRLGELEAQLVLVAIADRDPEFTYYCGSLANQPETLLELFRLYGSWVLNKLKIASGPAWTEIVETARGSERYRLLRMQWEQTSLLWEEWEGLVGRGN